MLVRSAGRRQQQHTSRLLAASFAQLNLPWLAPAQLRWSASHAAANGPQPAAIPKKRRDVNALRDRAQQHRGVATSADSYIPFESSLPPLGSPNGSSVPAQGHYTRYDFSKPSEIRSLYQRPYSDPIVLNTTIRTPEPLIKVQAGLSGTVQELLVHLKTSVSVGRRERAEAIIQRLAEQCSPHLPEMTFAHNCYLGEMLRDQSTKPTGSVLAKSVMVNMQKWFEREVRRKDVQPDATMLITMIRATIKAVDGPRLYRSIRRYVEIARHLHDDTFGEVLESEEYDDNEFTILGRATSEYYEEAPDYNEQSERLEQPEQVQSFRQDPTNADLVELASVPEVQPTQQRGRGLVNVKSVMSVLSGLPRLPPDAPEEERRRRAYERQQHLEDKAVDIAVEAWKAADQELRKIGINTVMQAKPIGALMWQWYEALVPLVRSEVEECKAALGNQSSKDSDRQLYGPYLELLTPEVIAASVITSTLMLMTSPNNNSKVQKYEFETRIASLTMTLGTALQDESHATLSREASKRKELSQSPVQRHRRMKKVIRRAHSKSASEDEDQLAEPVHSDSSLKSHIDVEWPSVVKIKIGAVMCSNLLKCAVLPVTREHPRTREQVTQMQPAFLHRVKFQYGKKVGVLLPNDALAVKLHSEPVGSMLAKRMPMLVEPVPWTGYDKGGYLHYKSQAIRMARGDKNGKDYFIAADHEGDLSTLYKGLTALGKVPWKINRDVFKVQLEAWNSGEAIGNLAPLHHGLVVPAEPEPSLDPEPRKKWIVAMREVENKRSSLHSQRCYQNFQLEIARSMLNETMYMPHNMDFRGRAYPIPPYLNHMGADNCRGLLAFAKGKELGEKGLHWLKIHLATVAGHDKASFQDRLNFVEQHLDDIYDSVRDPLGGRRWWAKAEDSWQTLAACFELTRALDSPDPTKFVSYLPMQQDGTCNGLQHYAALGGDKAGARQVNLEPGDKPADVYTAVAEAVKAEVRKDAEEGHALAKVLDGHIARKCVKQPVMTNVYGVTAYGVKLQVAKQLETMFPDIPRKGVDGSIMHLAAYLGVKIFKCLGDMFSGAQAIQSWLGLCADQIATCITPEQVEQIVSTLNNESHDGANEVLPETPSRKRHANIRKKARTPKQEMLEVAQKVSCAEYKATTGVWHSSKPLFKSSVVWTTPLGLPVVQPYRTVPSQKVKTKMQGIGIREPQVWDPVNRRKQLQAFPPNFIHSLDSTHMLLSAIKFDELGLTFASVHDSFWTHACDVDTLAEVLRDAFISLHSEDVVERLREEFETRYRGCFRLVPIPFSSRLGAELIKHGKSLQTNGKDNMSSDLADEVERQRLLQSANPSERKDGADMVTPASIVQAYRVREAAEKESTTRSNSSGFATVPNVDAIAEDEDAVDVDATEHVDFDAESESEEVTASAEGSDAKPIQKPIRRSLYIWMPVEFPPVPAKGTFDVTKIQESKYFFH